MVAGGSNKVMVVSRIIIRYLNREVFNTMLVITLILLAIFICNQFVRYLGDAAIGRMTAKSVLQMMTIQIPLLSGFMLPLGYFLGVLLTYGRLYTLNEMMALFCIGMSRWQLLGITMMGAGAVAGFVLVLMLWVEPEMAYYRDHILAEAAASSPMQRMLPGRFLVVSGRYVVYAESIVNGGNALENVFAAQLPAKSNQQTWSVLASKSAHLVVDPQTHEEYIEFQHGNRYEGNPGQRAFTMVNFREYGIRIPKVNVSMGRQEEFVPTRELWFEQKFNPVAAAEMQWRLSMPISVLILGLIAVSMSQVKPRQGRFAQLVPAVVVYIIYIDLLFVSRSWVEKGLLRPLIGLWWVHAVMLVLGVLLFLRFAGSLRRRSQ